MLTGDERARVLRRGPPAGAVRAGITLLVGVAVAYAVSEVVDVVAPLTVALVLGVVVRNVGLLPEPVREALNDATKVLLRTGVVALGLQLAVPELLQLSPGHLAVVVTTVVVTFAGTRWLGRLMQVSRERSLLLATGFSICGASAVAAVASVVDADEDDVATAIAMVTLYGSLAIAGFPVLQDVLGLSDRDFGVWIGASVHEVAQVVAAAGIAGQVALVVAVLAKLGRVVLLAPMITVIAVGERRRALSRASGGKRPPLIPLFVLGFLVMAGVRSTGLLPDTVVSWAGGITTALLSGAMFGLGAGVHVRSLVRTGGRTAALGAASTGLAAAVAYAGLLVVA